MTTRSVRRMAVGVSELRHFTSSRFSTRSSKEENWYSVPPTVTIPSIRVNGPPVAASMVTLPSVPSCTSSLPTTVSAA